MQQKKEQENQLQQVMKYSSHGSMEGSDDLFNDSGDEGSRIGAPEFVASESESDEDDESWKNSIFGDIYLNDFFEIKGKFWNI